MRQITTDDLRKMEGREGLILQSCGGELQEWVDGINNLLTEAGVLLNSSVFEAEAVSSFQHDGVTCLLSPFEGVELDMGRLAMWRLQTHRQFNSAGRFHSRRTTTQPGETSLSPDWSKRQYLQFGGHCRSHLTEKPLQLMRDIVKITEPGGHILDLFAGSGTTVLAAVLEGYTVTGIEVSDEYARLARERIIRELEQAA